MKKKHSGFIYFILILVAAVLSIFLAVEFTHLFSLSKNAGEHLLVVLFFVTYGILLFIWIHIDNNWWR